MFKKKQKDTVDNDLSLEIKSITEVISKYSLAIKNLEFQRSKLECFSNLDSIDRLKQRRVINTKIESLYGVLRAKQSELEKLTNNLRRNK